MTKTLTLVVLPIFCCKSANIMMKDGENHVETSSTAGNFHTALNVLDWVTITYSGDIYPVGILDIKNNDVKVNVMTETGKSVKNIHL